MSFRCPRRWTWYHGALALLYYRRRKEPLQQWATKSASSTIWRSCNEHNWYVAIVSSPDFDDDYLRMEVEPYVELAQSGNRVSGIYHVGLQQGDIDGHLEGEGRVGFSFEGMDELDEVHGRGELRTEGARARFVLAYHQGDTFTFIYQRPA